MAHDAHGTSSAPTGKGFWAAYNRVPLFVRILVAMTFGIILGELLPPATMLQIAPSLKIVSDTVLQLLKLLATPLIFIAVVHAIYKAQASGKTASRLFILLIRNTVVAIAIGLLVANVLQPGRWAHVANTGERLAKKPSNFFLDLIEKIPANLIDPLQHNEIISILILAVAFGVAMRIVRDQQTRDGKTRSSHHWRPAGYRLQHRHGHAALDFRHRAACRVRRCHSTGRHERRQAAYRHDRLRNRRRSRVGATGGLVSGKRAILLVGAPRPVSARRVRRSRDGVFHRQFRRHPSRNLCLHER